VSNLLQQLLGYVSAREQSSYPMKFLLYTLLFPQIDQQFLPTAFCVLMIFLQVCQPYVLDHSAIPNEASLWVMNTTLNSKRKGDNLQLFHHFPNVE